MVAVLYALQGLLNATHAVLLAAAEVVEILNAHRLLGCCTLQERLSMEAVQGRLT